ncbi:MAG: L-glutamate gamma-semialdehyde dehydrogenase [Gammaproteobacteria bacterium]|uniref:L-glutamate gamma-semialdehyde dehydrogenase n=1 Tax=Hydrogenophaga sp. TaxID=1904254 RepID=UPI0025B8487E|nr:L-glutamate gamma-semialdehyde dehydrogenase [Hydrogenophaga sp.]MBU4182211.1 L-glutamate gamma-semialdehyde dehydrogenase [Gammaproteobacteria bacterium]MBU4282113.1 L-glutamate gamma-semialdehyde dehydrogenase [Gammaproteobacteria bacterium]MBU4322267.1 L-glutamate gamma-semialdehyde dehydrogenase [Gammaproteobacteria bacterium]MCG2657495.1 L-glutamate gamma-semialdehyde dehydrogenase [Hydrogenophaga sp.]
MPRTTDRLPSPYRPETAIVAQRLAALQGALDWAAAAHVAAPWVRAVRENPPPFWAMESLLKEYPISSAEGLALMRLAEALLRVPDAETAIALTADQLGRADFDGAADSTLARLSSTAIAMSKHFLPGAGQDPGLMAKLGAKTVVAATLRAVQLLGRQFVLGQTIEEGMKEAASARKKLDQLRFSFDMLGEGARTDADALRYLASYENAIAAIARTADPKRSPAHNDGISIKLSALHPRFEAVQHGRVMEELVPRVWTLCRAAAAANLNLTIDAEEVDRLELSLDVFEALAQLVAEHCPQWSGLGLAMQAYQSRAVELIEHVAALARQYKIRFMCRLVKGAYWDAEIKRAQEQGLTTYPVFTHKHHTDVSYLACARALLDAPDAIFPQFATHNAGTISAILQMASRHGVPFELQRLHGMGEGIYREVLKNPLVACRVYAPVGAHRDLLAYLVRRLLENGANSSFVHQLADESVGMDELLISPLRLEPQPSLPLPADLYGAKRANSLGLDLAVAAMREPLLAALGNTPVPAVPEASTAETEAACAKAVAAFAGWNHTPVTERAATLRRAADALQQQLPRFCALLVKEAHKTWGDAVSEVREAVDFLRFYANDAERVMAPTTLPGPTGESNVLRLEGRGAWVCISPWNFPLAIFTGQVAAALATGNTVLAKPAEQTPAVALEAVKLLHAAGVPANALQLLHGPGETVGASLVAQAGIAGVVFTGSTQVAKIIQRALAAKDGAIVPLIAETGGINAMLVDSTALPEQVADAVVQSAFRSAGQRCSALRLLCLHEGIADHVIEMIQGAAKELVTGNPAELATDLGPVIDAEAFEGIGRHLRRLHAEATPLLPAAAPATTLPNLIPPQMFEVKAIADVKAEIFGPVLQVVRWGGDPMDVIRQINALGYGLTLGIQTRIDSRAQALATAARVGNVYVNRNMIGAVVGVQPFGGEGLSGTGPKAGGPNYLQRFCAEQTLTINTTAAGGNVALFAGPALH